jgi:hypothetical protein
MAGLYLFPEKLTYFFYGRVPTVEFLNPGQNKKKQKTKKKMVTSIQVS